MGFWLEAAWQRDAAIKIRDALQEVGIGLLKQNLSDGQWTKPMLAALISPSLALCQPYGAGAACSFGGGEAGGQRKGWLYDFCCWTEDANKNFTGLPIVVESEWGAWKEVLDDFDKLSQARAGLRVLIFQQRRKDREDWEGQLYARAKAFAQSDASDAWLFACWCDKQFVIRSNRLE